MVTRRARHEAAVALVLVAVAAALAAGTAMLPSEGGYAGIGPNFMPAVVSGKDGLGLGELSRRVLSEAAGAAASAPLDPGSPRFLVSARQESLCLECERSLGRAQEAVESSMGLEYAAADLRDALRWLEDLVGREPRESVLDWIFSRFCIGK